ncbi:hypothetical protein MRB53_030540 [Persea americana]|uniref:Uncharacterized protein n=1 Tax=Persea americana TaxID=3435 RepID=A0ACC2KLV1_PERAE|nr:hypothetical protein MRB53_030540 [Persea americana]
MSITLLIHSLNFSPQNFPVSVLFPSLCNSMADLDFGAPSFSLGLDLDLDLDLDFDSAPSTSPPKQSLPKSDEHSSIKSNFPTLEDEDFELQETPDPDPPVLKRLRRRPRTPPPLPISPQKSAQLLNAEDEIEDFSSQEDRAKDEHPSGQNRSAGSSSKFSLHSQRILKTQSASNLKTQKSTPASSASTFAILDGSSSRGTLPKLTTSPLRKIHLLDSDSDDPPSSEDQPENFEKVGSCTKGREHSSNHAIAGNQQSIAKMSSNKLQTESLWKDLGPKKNTKLATPALDEFCEEYFRSMKDKNADKRKKGDMGNISFRSPSNEKLLEEIEVCSQENSIHRHCEQFVKQLDPQPSAYRGSEHSETTVLDYMSQFGHRDAPTKVQVTRNKVHEGSSKTKKRSRSNANVIASQASEGWVNPKTCATIPRNAGKRRVRADSHSAGHWYTGQDGRKVYVSKNGQELTGQAAYRHYRKESGTGF